MNDKIPNLETLSRILQNQATIKKMISFCRVWYLVIWYASRLATASNLPNLFNDQKHKFQDHDTLKSPWLMPRSTLIENYPFLENPSSHNPFLLIEIVSAILWTITPFFADISGNLLSHTLFFGQKWREQPLNQKTTLFQNNSHMRSGASIWKVIYGMRRCPE